MRRKRNKFGAIKTVVDGITFSSKLEANRYKELKLLEQSGVIQKLKRQVRFNLTVNDILICFYLADFTYNENNSLIVDESKGKETAVWRLKKKLFQACYPHLELRMNGVRVKPTRRR